MPTAPPIHNGSASKCRSAWERSAKNKNKTTSERGYGWNWQKYIRPRIIARDNGLCQQCLRNGVVKSFYAVDHIKPKAKGGKDEDSNLECICKQCHATKTAREDSK